MDWTIGIIIAAAILTAVFYYYLKVYQKPRRDEMEQPYTQGLNCMLAGDIEGAKEKFNEAVYLDSDNVDAYLKLGAIMRQKGQPTSAVKVHQSLTVRSGLKPAQKIDIHRELALDYELAGAFLKAANSIDQILSISPDHLWALNFRIRLAEKLQDWPTAFSFLKKVNSLEGKKDNQRLALYRVEEGRDLMKAGRQKDGRIKCREAIKLEKTCAFAYLTLAQSYIAEGREEDAVKELKNVLEHSPERGHLAYGDLEDLYFNLGKFGELETLYRDIIRKQPENLPAYKSLARFLRKKGEIELALQVCQDALERHPDDLWVRRFMIRAMVETNRLSEIGPLVIEVLDRVLVEAPYYTCEVCGHHSQEPLWRCPACSSLDTFSL